MDNNDLRSNNQTQSELGSNNQPITQVQISKKRSPLLIPVIVILWIGSLVGVYFLSMMINKDTNKVNESTTKTDTKNDQMPIDEKDETKSTPTEKTTNIDTSKWVPYKPSTGVYEVSIPDGWVLTAPEDKEDLLSYKATSIVLSSGIAGKVEQQIPNQKNQSEGSSVSFYLIYNYVKNEKAYLSDELVKEKSYKTKNGIEVTKFKRTGKDETEKSNSSLKPEDAIQYTYDLVLGTKNIHIVHDVLKDETDQTKVIEAMIETIKFL